MYEVIVGRSESDRKALGLVGTIYLGKMYVKMGAVTSLSNKVYLDVAHSHVVFISGKRGTGKCLTGDSLISLEDGSLMPMKDIENNNLNILGLNDTLKINKSKRTEFFKREVDEIIQIKLRSGKEIKLTPKHPLLTIKGWKPVQELKIGSRIATPRILNNFGQEIMPEHEIKILAYLIAEGYMKTSVLFSNNDEKIIMEFRNSLNNLDNNLKLVKDKKDHYRIVEKNYNTKIISFKANRNEIGQFKAGKNSSIYKKRTIRELLENYKLFGTGSLQRFIPQKILKLKKEQLALFLNRLFSCDGSIYCTKGYWEASYCSSSKQLIREVHHLLLRFGILSKIRQKTIKLNSKIFYSEELVITGENVTKYIEEIGFFGIKKEKSKKCLEETISIKRNPNIDTIPKEIWELYQPKSWTEIGRAVGYSHPKAMRERIRYSPSRQTLMQIAIADSQNGLKLLAESDIFWDEIIEMKLIEEKTTVYDIAVPEHHNFIANDIIVHNSYTMGVMAEEMANLPSEIANRLAVLIVDTMGIYWTMKFPNEKDEDLLREWDLPKKGLDVKIYTPAGFHQKYKDNGIPTDFPFTIRPSELDSSDWAGAFSVSILEDLGIAIERTVEKTKERFNDSYSIDDMVSIVREDERLDAKTKLALENRLLATKEWGLFDVEGTPLKNIIAGGQTTVLDISCYNNWTIKCLVLGIICRRLMLERMQSRKEEELEDVEKGHSYFKTTVETKEGELPIVWIMIDECLAGESKIMTEKGLIKIKNIVESIEKGENINVLSLNNNSKKYEYKEITKSYRIRPRELIEITTETGEKIKCTADHPLLTKTGYLSAINAKEIATPLRYNYIKNKELIKTRILGHIFGDGYLSKSKIIGFSGKGFQEDLYNIKEELKLLGFSSSKIYSRITTSIIKDEFGKENKVIGLSEEIRSSWKAWAFFKNLGAPVGEKVLSSTKIPEFIMQGSNEIKAEFLAALMGSDGFGLTKSKNSKLDFNAIRLSFNKIESLEKEAWEYASQIRELFNSLGIEISSIKRKSGNIRKDDNKTIKILITLSKNIENTIKFLESIGFRYCTKKEIQAKKYLAYLKSYKERLLEIKKQINQTLTMKKEFSLNEISEKINVPHNKIRMWSKQKILGASTWDFPEFNEWVNERVKDEILYEKIKEIKICEPEELFDITVKDNHNFIANSFIVHNCHEFLPKDYKTLSTDSLITILREGRQPGVCLVLVSQQPGQVHTDVLTQTDIIICHRITAKRDVEALNSMMQAYTSGDIQKYLNQLPTELGSAVILDDNSERMFPIRTHPRFTWHGGEAPTAVKAKSTSLERLGL